MSPSNRVPYSGPASEESNKVEFDRAINKLLPIDKNKCSQESYFTPCFFIPSTNAGFTDLAKADAESRAMIATNFKVAILNETIEN